MAGTRQILLSIPAAAVGLCLVLLPSILYHCNQRGTYVLAFWAAVTIAALAVPLFFLFDRRVMRRPIAAAFAGACVIALVLGLNRPAFTPDRIVWLSIFDVPYMAGVDDPSASYTGDGCVRVPAGTPQVVFADMTRDLGFPMAASYLGEATLDDGRTFAVEISRPGGRLGIPGMIGCYQAEGKSLEALEKLVRDVEKAFAPMPRSEKPKPEGEEAPPRGEVRP